VQEHGGYDTNRLQLGRQGYTHGGFEENKLGFGKRNALHCRCGVLQSLHFLVGSTVTYLQASVKAKQLAAKCAKQVQLSGAALLRQQFGTTLF